MDTISGYICRINALRVYDESYAKKKTHVQMITVNSKKEKKKRRKKEGKEKEKKKKETIMYIKYRNTE